MAFLMLLFILVGYINYTASHPGQGSSYMIQDDASICNEQFLPTTLAPKHISNLLHYHYRYYEKELRNIQCLMHESQLHACYSTLPIAYKSRWYTRQYFAKVDVLIQSACQRGGVKAVMGILTTPSHMI